MFKDMNVEKKVNELLRDIEKSKNPDIIKDLCDLLEDIMKIRKLESELEKLNENLYSGLRAAFFAHTMNITELDTQYLLEKAKAKKKRMEELKRRESAGGKELSEDEQNELKRLGLLSCEKCIDKDECDCPKPVKEKSKTSEDDVSKTESEEELEKGGAMVDKI